MKLTIYSLSLLVLLLIFSTPTFAVDFTVNLTTDEHDANTLDNVCDADLATLEEQCTLRAAVEQANALSTDDSITFNDLFGNLTITLTTFNGGEIKIENNGSLMIKGLGANRLTVDGGAGTNRIFYSSGATLLISGLTLTGGNGAGTTVNDAGGAIFADDGTLTLDSVHITGNSAVERGGGVYFAGHGTFSIINSTFSNNNAFTGGGFEIEGYLLTVVNSTISGNMARNGGGGGFFTNNAYVTLRSVTITNNTARNGGGIFQYDGRMYIGNSILAGNTATNIGREFDFRRSIFSNGFNLIGDSEGDSTNTGGIISYRSTDILDTNPMLSALAYNGSSVPTHALLPGSPLIDKGYSFDSMTDQRGLTRPIDLSSIPNSTGGDGSDIGAFEVQVTPTAASITVGGRIITANRRGIDNARVTITDSNGETRTALTNPLGYYQFFDVQAGATYVVRVSHKRYQFSQSIKVLLVNEETSGINFVAEN